MTCKTVAVAMGKTIQIVLYCMCDLLGLFCLLSEMTEGFGAQKCICSSIYLHSKQKLKANA